MKDSTFVALIALAFNTLLIWLILWAMKPKFVRTEETKNLDSSQVKVNHGMAFVVAFLISAAISAYYKFFIASSDYNMRFGGSFYA